MHVYLGNYVSQLYLPVALILSNPLIYVSDRPWGPPSLLYNVYRVFPGGKEWPGRDADPSPPSSAVVKKG